MILKNFPRGGKKPDVKPSNKLFSKRKKIKVKKSKPKSKDPNTSATPDDPIVLGKAENLRFSALREGMVVYGRIFKVTDYYMVVSLPGQISGKLQATDISSRYTTLLRSITESEDVSSDFKPLSDIYTEGDRIVCYVKEIDAANKNVSVSLEPQLVNQNLNPGTLTKCSKLVLSVSSVEDHGYVLETGLKNLRAFLSTTDLGDSKVQLHPGKQIMCAVKSVKSAEDILTAKISIKPKHLSSVEPEVHSLDSLVPGALFSLTVRKILSNGLQVHFGENNIGYVNELYVQNRLSSFEKGQELVGTLLYVVPTVKFAYFSLLPHQPDKKVLDIGDKIDKAKVISRDSRGILLQLKKGVRGFVTSKRTEVDYEKIPSVFTPDSIHKCKIIAYDSIARVYICTMEKKLMEENFVNKAKLSPGDLTEVKILEVSGTNGFLKVSLGNIFGSVPPDHISDPGSREKLKIGQTVKARILEKSENLFFTLKKSLIDTKLPILSKIEDAKVNSTHDGSVMKIRDQGVLVRFFGNVKGWIPKRFLDKRIESLKWNMVVGQTIPVVIKDVKLGENKLTLAPTNLQIIGSSKYKIGDLVEGVVIDSSINGVNLKLNDNDGLVAFLPAGHMAPCLEVGQLLAAKTVAGDIFPAVVFSTRPSVILTSTFAPATVQRVKDLNIGDTLLCSVKRIHKESVKVLMPINKCSKYGTIPISKIGYVESCHENQLLFGKILEVNKETQEIQLTAQLGEVWKSIADQDARMMAAVDVLSSYLNKLSELSKNVYYTSKPISKINIGQRIKATVESIMDRGLVLKLDRDVKGLVRTGHYSGSYKQGDTVEGVVLWVNYPHEFVEISLNRHVIESISEDNSELEEIPIGEQLRGEIVLATDWFVLVALKGKAKGVLVTLPARRHLNDTVPDLSPYQIGKKVRCYGVLNKQDDGLLVPICMLKSAFEIRNSDEKKLVNAPASLKRKAETTTNAQDDTTAKKLKLDKKNQTNPDKHGQLKKNSQQSDGKKAVQASEKLTGAKKSELQDGRKSNQIVVKRAEEEDDSDSEEDDEDQDEIEDSGLDQEIEDSESDINNEEKMEIEEKSPNVPQKEPALTLSMPECGFKWENSTSNQPQEESSSDDDEDEDADGESGPQKKKKKKKLSAAERRELERQKEREIREREEALASCQMPQTVDQFDRLVLSSPDSSLVWVQYMAHHLQATEIDKARAVARRALKTISFREEEERLNVWQAWLNLESRFGTNESLDEVFKEAVKTNDARKVYNHMLNVHVDAGRQAELEKTVNAMIGKFKYESDTWTECGAALLKVGMKDRSRHVMQRALQSLPAKKHVEVLVKFAQLENKFGDKERSQTLFEQVLSSYPKRTDVWSSYVDSLVKSGDIDLARKVLDRAILQVIPAKKMKVLFKKYISFETKHGTPENVSRIQDLAVKYVEEQCNKVE
ncbi:hypothetical protein QAD02_019483 [Eretmocerus hayati]|uniref:Uncharacterized protein n=1 Tax=Eretmocerus hayati TaxID=131215 RepID=A0ACC2PJR0_9HYME|nr:hypothetical protein QAD02_019483 [Eretmocerus hayati]